METPLEEDIGAGSSVALGLVGAGVDKDNKLVKDVSYIGKSVVLDLIGDEVSSDGR